MYVIHERTGDERSESSQLEDELGQDEVKSRISKARPETHCGALFQFHMNTANMFTYDCVLLTFYSLKKYLYLNAADVTSETQKSRFTVNR